MHIITGKKFNIYRKFNLYETQNTKNSLNQKLQELPIITVHILYIYISIMAVLIIFPVILQTVINLIMLSIGGQRALDIH